MIDDHDFQETCNSDTKPMSPIKLLPKVRIRGRPKGAGLTIVGLPRIKEKQW